MMNKYEALIDALFRVFTFTSKHIKSDFYNDEKCGWCRAG